MKIAYKAIVDQSRGFPLAMELKRAGATAIMLAGGFTNNDLRALENEVEVMHALKGS